VLDCLAGFFLDLEVDLRADPVSGGGGLAEGGSPPPPAAKAGTDGGDAIRATENSASVASLIADFIVRTLRVSCVSESMVQPQVQTPPGGKYSRGTRGSVARCGRLDE
jgi:hypothetical protein